MCTHGDRQGGGKEAGSGICVNMWRKEEKDSCGQTKKKTKCSQRWDQTKQTWV